MKKIMKTFMKRILCVAAVLCLAGIVNFPVHAQEGKIVVALGADLSAEQRATVLSLMGITEEQLAGYEVIYITNAQEHQYLDAYLDASVIGSKSLSSVMLKKGAKGSGVNVTTKNINYCTTECAFDRRCAGYRGDCGSTYPDFRYRRVNRCGKGL